jgi:choline dehydrogenase-like flavoprotein
MEQALGAAGGGEIWWENDDTCHLNGTARMEDDPSVSVVNADCRSWDIRNLWICDGSVLPTVGGVNPSLTIQAIACRTAGRIVEPAAHGELKATHLCRTDMQSASRFQSREVNEIDLKSG